MATRSLTEAALLCIGSFEALIGYTHAEVYSTKYGRQMPAQALRDELGRFRVWAGNIGALQPATKTTSLESCLREASQVKRQVVKLLLDLYQSLDQCIAIVCDERPQRLSSEEEEDDLGEIFSDVSDSNGSTDSYNSVHGPTCELEQLLLAVSETITSLHKLSILIRKHTARDRYANAAALVPLDAADDINHVYNMFPRLRSLPWLVEKLGRANTRRRELLIYRERHHSELARNVGATEIDNEEWQPTLAQGNPSAEISTSVTVPVSLAEHSNPVKLRQLSSTEATFSLPVHEGHLELDPDTAKSETSYVTSDTDDTIGGNRPIPEAPKESAGGNPFECPYCYTIQIVRNSSQWKKHVLSDLEPYTCTFDNRSTRMFASRHEWAQHELQMHYKQWLCAFCLTGTFTSTASLSTHLEECHPEYTDQQRPSLLTICGKTPKFIPIPSCLFCDWVPSEAQGTVIAAELFHGHVGRHLEHLALFALPFSTQHTSETSSSHAALSKERSSNLAMSTKNSNVTNIARSVNTKTQYINQLNDTTDHDEITDEHKRGCLQPLAFPEMMKRENVITEAANETCTWLSEDPIYRLWLNQRSGAIWITGHPGVGKSTLIKYASQKERSRGDTIFASYFFDRRGTLIQKSTLGLFRSLLYQIILQVPSLLLELTAVFQRRCETDGAFREKWTWHERELQDFFKAAVVRIAEIDRIRIFIDALDESGEKNTNSLTHFFNQIENSLSICFSCRYYPMVAPGYGLKIHVEDNNAQDIKAFVSQELEKDHFRPIRDKIIRKASGNFLWVKLAVSLVPKLDRDGVPMETIKTEIEQPQEEMNMRYNI